MMSAKVILVGGFIEIIELCENNGLEIFGIIDFCKKDEMYSFKILGTDNDARFFSNQIKQYPLILTPDSPVTRTKLEKYYKNLDFCFTRLLSSQSFISKRAIIGQGTVIQSGVNVSSEVVIGDFVKINNHANIMHNVKIGDFTTIAPNAIVLGNVKIGNGCYIGANSTILPNISIADNVVIGAGAVVTKNILEPGGVYVGIPARKLH